MAGLEMHPLDEVDRTPFLKDQAGLGFCNITKCCTEVCPEDIHITDNAIIPLKERVVTRFYDPIGNLLSSIFGGNKKKKKKLPAATTQVKQPVKTP
jgi:succinate dehydrogenase / fumarate reductase iron-sulfur subunit